MKRNIFSILILILFFSFLNIKEVFSAKAYFKVYETENENNYLVDVLLDTENESLNALDGKVIFPKDLVKIEEIKDGNSVINFWLEKPNISNSGEISFAGITPGGFIGKDLLIFSFNLSQSSINNGFLGLKGLNLFKNDGTGEKASVISTNLSLPLSKISDIDKKEIIDNNPPENFSPEILKYDGLFDNKYVLVFATQDKGVGIKGYEVKEGNGEFKSAESPYILENQGLNKKIYVKAIDNSNNEIVVQFIPENYKHWYEYYGIIVIIILVSCAFIFRKKWLKIIK